MELCGFMVKDENNKSKIDIATIFNTGVSLQYYNILRTENDNGYILSYFDYSTNEPKVCYGKIVGENINIVDGDVASVHTDSKKNKCICKDDKECVLDCSARTKIVYINHKYIDKTPFMTGVRASY
jgi:hypothetical protein